MKKTKTRCAEALTALLLILFFRPHAIAMINMRLASYSNEWTDFDFSALHEEFKIRRIYNSRSRFNGMVGYGWCFNIEIKIITEPDGSLKLYECGKSGAIQYQKSPNTDEWRPESGTQERISASGIYYLRTTAGNGVQRFLKSTGRLTAIFDHQHRELKISYDVVGRPRALQLASGVKLYLDFEGDSLRVNSIHGLGQRKTYLLKNLDLILVTSQSDRGYDDQAKYVYDSFHNLTQVGRQSSGRQKILENITYDSAQDRVLSVTDELGCMTRFFYLIDPKLPRDHFSTQSFRRCPGRPYNAVKYDFWYRPTHLAHGNESSPAARYLAIMEVEKNREMRKFVFQPDGSQQIEVSQSSLDAKSNPFSNSQK